MTTATVISNSSIPIGIPIVVKNLHQIHNDWLHGKIYWHGKTMNLCIQINVCTVCVDN